jgi:RimJ/RimL family protein N-acetyltransferase
MGFKNTTYKNLSQQIFIKEDYKIVPLRYQDRFDIMQWRNDQMYHLRQVEILTKDSQDSYFKNTIAKLFEVQYPNQILFSYLKNDLCIGYGGIVHIDWRIKTAEVSFIMDTKLERDFFEFNWTKFLSLLKKVVFDELHFNHIFTYTYNLRPHLYKILEKNLFEFKSKKKDEIEVDGKKVDVLIHQCENPYNYLNIREITKDDINLIYNWSNDLVVRSQSFNSDPINFDNHVKWFEQKLTSAKSLLFVNEYKGTPVGLVRFEKKENHTVLGILLGKDYRGKGLSSIMLIKSSKHYFLNNELSILAYIKESNIASVKAFEKAGYFFVKNILVNEISTVVYKLEKNGIK